MKSADELRLFNVVGQKASEIYETPGWLSPSGELYPCEAYEHFATAMAICDQQGIDVEYSEDDTLHSLGWLHIDMDGEPYSHLGYEPTQAQLDALMDMAGVSKNKFQDNLWEYIHDHTELR